MKNGNRILLVLFCAGIIGGMLLPGWFWPYGGLKLEILSISSLRQYSGLAIDCGEILRRIAGSRLTVMLLLFFSAYTAAGVWILRGTALSFGLSFGFLAALCTVQLGGWGIVFFACGLLPQWILYVLAGCRIAKYTERRRARASLCGDPVVSGGSRRAFLEFLKLLGLVCGGIFLEAYLNPWLIRQFVKIYLKIS